MRVEALEIEEALIPTNRCSVDLMLSTVNWICNSTVSKVNLFGYIVY